MYIYPRELRLERDVNTFVQNKADGQPYFDTGGGSGIVQGIKRNHVARNKWRMNRMIWNRDMAVEKKDSEGQFSRFRDDLSLLSTSCRPLVVTHSLLFR